MTATVEDLEDLISDPKNQKEASENLTKAMERSFAVYEDLKRDIPCTGELSMTLLLLGAAGAMIAVAGDKTEELKRKALENALTFVAIYVKDFVEYETRELQ